MQCVLEHILQTIQYLIQLRQYDNSKDKFWEPFVKYSILKSETELIFRLFIHLDPIWMWIQASWCGPVQYSFMKYWNSQYLFNCHKTFLCRHKTGVPQALFKNAAPIIAFCQTISWNLKIHLTYTYSASLIQRTSIQRFSCY